MHSSDSPFHRGGLKVWGEYISKDLVHWEYAGVPLVADSPYDCHGAYSGSAFTEDGMLELFYTGNIKYEGDYDYVNTGRESNTIYTASKDGRKFGEKECAQSRESYPKAILPISGIQKYGKKRADTIWCWEEERQMTREP